MKHTSDVDVFTQRLGREEEIPKKKKRLKYIEVIGRFKGT